MAWIEYHDTLLDFWKVQRLAHKLAIPYAHALGLISCLWLWTLKNAPEGDLSKFTNEEIARAAKWEGAGNGFRDDLQECELLDKAGHVHRWERYGNRLLREARERVRTFREGKHVKRYRKHNRNVT